MARFLQIRARLRSSAKTMELTLNRILFTLLCTTTISGCSSHVATSSAKESAEKKEMRVFATCNNLSYDGGYYLTIKESSSSDRAEMLLEHLAGPDGDGWVMPEQEFVGLKSNADERDPYSFEYKFGGMELSITLERSEGVYPAVLKVDGQEETMHCNIK